MHTRLEWKVTHVRSVAVIVTQKDGHEDNHPKAWCRDKGSGELKPSDNFVSKANRVSDYPIETCTTHIYDIVVALCN
jgi:hypothetical protein